MMELVKIPIVSAYYLIHVMFDKWMNWAMVLALILAAVLGIQLAKKNIEIGKKWKLGTFIWLLILYFGIVIWVFQCGGLEKGIYDIVLHIVYCIGAILSAMLLGNAGWNSFVKTGEKECFLASPSFYKKLNIGLITAFLLSLIPIIRISPYTFARADDYSFGYRAHLALENTGSFLEVIKAAAVVVAEKYMEWQGTYSSIFFMAMQPAVFDEKLYRIVPMFFIIIIALASYFFMKNILVDFLQADRTMSMTCIIAYVFLVIQCMPVKQSAFFWYNGALHYIVAHCLLLCMLVFLLRIVQGKATKWNYAGAILCAVYIGGSNYVTLVGTLLIYLTIFFVLTVTKSWKKYKGIAGIGVIYLIASIINILAPGNFKKIGTAQGYGLIQSFVYAFTKSLAYILGEWMHWSVFALIAVSMPILWKAVKKIKFEFSYPLLVIIYSWCYMASLFFMPLFTKATVDIGRLNNIMYLEWILWILIDIGYFFGWLQRKYFVEETMCVCSNEKKYYIKVFSAILGMVVLSFIAEPHQYTSIFAMETLRDEKLQEYSRDYWENIEILKGKEKEVLVNSLDNIPEFLYPEECEAWHSGLRFFYGKDKIYLEE